MGTYTGTTLKDTITPDTVSAGVTAVPAGSTPSAAADAINGNGGNDTLDGGFGGDTINGGLGDDNIDDSPRHWTDAGVAAGVNAGNVIHGEVGNDAVTINIVDSGDANPVDNAAYGDDGNDTLALTIANDNYIGWKGDLPTGTVSLDGGNGADLLEVREEYLKATGMTTALYGGTGDDDLRATVWTWEPDGSFNGGDNPDRLYGGTGDDSYFVLEQKDLVIEKANEGYDTIEADKTDYILPANVEKLVMSNIAYYPEETFSGTGNELNNVIIGWASTWDDDGVGERLDGAGGNDTIYGSPVSDEHTYEFYDRDTIHGGTGNDTIYGCGASEASIQGSILVDNDILYGDDGNDEIFGLYGNDLIYGGTGDDNLYGQSDNDTMHGGAGNERVYGGTGNDTLYGDDGVDNVRGGDGLDRVSGGGGNDRYDYDYVTDSKPGAANRDVILDFNGVGAAVGDRIDLSTIDANTGVSGNQAFVFKSTGAITGAGQVHLVASGADTLIQANTGGTTAPELEVMVHDGTALPTQWVAGDFIL